MTITLHHLQLLINDHNNEQFYQEIVTIFPTFDDDLIDDISTYIINMFDYTHLSTLTNIENTLLSVNTYVSNQ